MNLYFSKLLIIVFDAKTFPLFVLAEVIQRKWNSRYPSIAKSWIKRWENGISLFSYPDDIRKIIYTTNVIESLNSVIRKTIKNRRIFPNDTSAFKVVFLAIQKASEWWTMPLRNWKPAMNRFLIENEDRFPEM